jgi:hypothetical protein
MKCSYNKCNNEFEPRTHNMKYCSNECCRTATNEKLREAYYEKKARLAGKKRICKTPGCNVVLSRYNEDKVCNRCANAKKDADRKEMIEAIRNVIGKIS